MMQLKLAFIEVIKKTKIMTVELFEINFVDSNHTNLDVLIDNMCIYFD